MILFKVTKYLILTKCIEKILDTIYFNFKVAPKLNALNFRTNNKYKDKLRGLLKEISTWNLKPHTSRKVSDLIPSDFNDQERDELVDVLIEVETQLMDKLGNNQP